MAKRRDTMAPYEIMGAAQRSAAAAPAESGGEGEADSSLPKASWSEGLRDLWDAGVPVVLRVPRGFAIMFCVGVVGLMVLSWWVGYQQGASAREEQLKYEWEQGGRSTRVPQGVAPQFVDPSSADAENLGSAGAEPRIVGQDPRKVGLNYLVLARTAKQEADRLAIFLAGRGVETIVIPDDNARFHVVVGLQGLTTEQYRAGDHREYERRMRQLGRDWQAYNKGKGLNLSDMYWDLYTGQ